MIEGERQVSPTVDGIRADHTHRYKWVRSKIEGSVLDAACGIGYGSKILAEAGHKVRAIDIDPEAIGYAERYYSHPDVKYQCVDLLKAGPFLNQTTVAFEMIEHIEKPLPFLERLNGKLIASVPNEDLFPYKNYKFHFRHYTKNEFEDLLGQAGFEVESWHGQQGPESNVEDIAGRTIIAIARR